MPPSNAPIAPLGFARPPAEPARGFFASRILRQAQNDIAVAFARAAHLSKTIDEFPIEPDPNQSVWTRARRRVGGA